MNISIEELFLATPHAALQQRTGEKKCPHHNGTGYCHHCRGYGHRGLPRFRPPLSNPATGTIVLGFAEAIVGKEQPIFPQNRVHRTLTFGRGFLLLVLFHAVQELDYFPLVFEKGTGILVSLKKRWLTSDRLQKRQLAGSA